MKPLYIKETDKTPTVNFNPTSGNLELIGRSFPENALLFYQPIINWCKEYAKHPGETTIVNLKLEHFNSSSSKCLFTLLKTFETLNLNKNQITVNWYCEDDDEEMMEIFYNFDSLIPIPLKLIAEE